MFVRILVALACMAGFAQSALADWTLSGQADRFDSYVDATTRRPSGNTVRMWVMTDYKAAEKNSAGREFLSDKILYEFDCAAETLRTIAWINYSGQMGAGQTVNSSEAPGNMRNVVPGSIGEAHFRTACDGIAVGRRAPPAANQSADFALVNRSSEVILTLYLRPSGGSGWGDDRLGNAVISPGERFAVRMPNNGVCRYDVRVWYSPDRAEDRLNQNLCALSDITFDGAGARNM